MKEHKLFAEWAEDRRAFPYEDSVGKITIGIGRNLDDRGLSEDEIDYLFANDQKIVNQEIHRMFPWYEGLDDVRKLVVFDMVFNMGSRRFSGFVRTIAALKHGDYQEAADEMTDSRWYRQTGRRSKVLVEAMRTGKLDRRKYAT
jgi:lysozyme